MPADNLRINSIPLLSNFDIIIHFVVPSLLAAGLYCVVDTLLTPLSPPIRTVDIGRPLSPNLKYLNLSTSIWCRSNDDGDCGRSSSGCRTCRFRNLCYRPDLDEYLFFQGDDTIVSGLNALHPSPTQTPVVGMSSVDGLNVHHLTLTELPSDAASKLGNIVMLDDSSIVLLMKRFKPDNLMHVFHDDLLPLFATILSEVCSLDGGRQLEDGIGDVRLVLLDGHAGHDYFPLYSLFSGAAKPLLAEDFVTDGRTYCFTSAIVGLSKETVWYDYGFGRPQGASGRDIPAAILRRFVAYILQRLNVNDRTCTSEDAYAVLVLRRTNRQILNSVEVMEAVASTTGLRVVVLDPDDTRIARAVQLVACSELLVGMHGATLILSLFLKPESAILELFPYNVPSKDYTPYRTLAGIPGLKLKYAAWENRVRGNTKTHPDWSREVGGLGHLEETEQRRIESSDSPVLPHYCCSHPEWLFRIYQDTTVDIPSFADILGRLMASSSADGHNETSIHPGPVRNLKCHVITLNDETKYRVVWDPPWNLQFASPPRTQCDGAAIWTQRVGKHVVESIVTEASDHVFRVADASIREPYHCWVSCTVANRTGIMQWIECK